MRALDAAPLAAGEVVYDFALEFGLELERVEVVDDQIGGRAFGQHAAVAEAGRAGGQVGEAVVRLLERDLAGVAHHPDQEVGGVGAGGEEFGVRAAVGDARDGVGRLDDFGHMVRIGVTDFGEELGLEVGGEREVEHGVDRVFAHLLADFGEGQADVLFELGHGLEVLDHHLLDRAADRLRLAQLFDRVVHFGLEPAAHLRVGELSLLFLGGAGGGVVPGRRGVVEVPVLEGVGEGGADREGLAEDALAARVALVEPLERLEVGVGALRVGGDHVVQDRAARDAGELGLECEVAFDVAGRLSDLDEALIAVAQHLGQGEALVVAHDVGHHRGAVVVGLDGAFAQPLG